MPTWHRLILLCDDSDGISTGAHGIVTIVIGDSRQVQCAFFARPLRQITDIVFEMQQGFEGIELAVKAFADLIFRSVLAESFASSSDAVP